MPPIQRGRYHALDALRGLLALSVAVGHFSSWSGHHTISGAVVLAVDFFFCLSGFVLTRSIARYKGDDRDWLPEFLTRRFFRLWPTYLLAVLITVGFLFPILRHQPMNLNAYQVVNVLMLGQSVGFGIPTSILTDTALSVAWSASVEFWIGVPFFFFVFLLRRRLDIATVLSALIGGFVIVYMWKFSPNYLAAGWQLAFVIVPFTVLRGLVGFSAGVIAYYIMDVWKPKGGTLWEVLVIATIFGLFASPSFNRFNDFLIPPLSVLAIVIFAAQSGLVSRLFALKPFQILGAASYPVYMLHIVFWDIWRHTGLPYNSLVIALYLGITVGFGYAVHVFIEQPFIRKGQTYRIRNGRSFDVSQLGASLAGKTDIKDSHQMPNTSVEMR